MKSLPLACVVASCSLLVPALASAQDANGGELNEKGAVNVNSSRPSLPAVSAASPAGRFGDKNQIVISSDNELAIRSTSTSGVDGSTTSVKLFPAIDYFVIDNVTFGGFMSFEHTSTPGTPSGKSTTFGIGPRVGYNLAFSERFSFWPKLGLSYTHTSLKTDPVGPVPGFDSSNSHLTLNVFAPVLFHPVKHFFVGLGPGFDTDLTGDAKQTTIAGRLTIGGWLDY